MNMNTMGILFSNLNDQTLFGMTATRTVAAIPFACRYRLVDFPLSAMVHAGIGQVSIVANYNFHSLADHVGSGKDWDLARHNGGVTLVSPFQNANGQHATVYSTHLEALLSMRESIDESRAGTVVMADCEYVCNPDLKEILLRHKESGAKITMVAYDCPRDYHIASPRIMVGRDPQTGTPRVVLGNRYDEAHPLLSANIFVIEMDYLRSLLQDAVAHNYRSLSRDILMRDTTNLHIIRYDGTVYHIASFEDYYRSSMALLANRAQRRELLGRQEQRVLTNVRNSAPVMYGSTAKVSDSLIADDCVIEGTVENCILFRGVHIGKGAVVKNSVLLSGTYVAGNAKLNCVVTDRNVLIGNDRNLSGCDELPIYIEKGRRI